MPDSGLASLADARVLYLTTIGRRSGQPRTIEIWFTCYQGKLYLNLYIGSGNGAVYQLVADQ